MKNLLYALFIGLGTLLAMPLLAQQQYAVYFSHGKEFFAENAKAPAPVSAAETVGGYYVRYVQFEKILTSEQRASLAAQGVSFMGYVHFGAYRMAFPTGFDLHILSDFSARSIVPAEPSWKMHRNLKERPFGAWAVHGSKVEIAIQVYSFLTIDEGVKLASEQGLEVVSRGNQNGYLMLRVEQADLDKVAAMPFVQWMELKQAPPVPDDLNGRSLHRANLLDSDHPLGKKYNGAGVNTLVRDDGGVGPHIDFQGRLYNQDDVGPALSGTHGDGVAGIIGGAGNLDPTKKGMAAGADVYVVDYVNSFQDATLPLYLNKNVTVTNSSYSDGCNDGYTLASQTVDQQIFEHPYLIHVFSAGNSNNNDCGYGAGNQWGNVTGGHKMAKNAIATANLRVDAALEGSSSRGPAYDGRLKPDISAHGAEQNSTDPENEYQVFGGTSAAAPGIAGCLAQLTQAYREINNEPDAPTALLKLAVLNTANEMGNIGPDFKFGWGHVNNWRALQLLEQHRYTNGSVDQGASNTHSVTIPSNTKQAKLMIYWVDPPAEENAAKALINDLDITVTGPDGTVYQPWKLDPTPNAAILDTPAGTGRDSLNNMEQVAIENPGSGVYTVNVNGYEVPMGPQSYYLAWEFLNDRVKLVYPAGGESLVPGTKEWIRWDAYGNTDPFILRYSVDGGNSFIAMGSPANNSRMLEWTVPNVTSGNVKMLLIRGGRRDTTQLPITIAPQPSNMVVEKVCPDSMTISWTPIANDTLAYDILMLGEKYMDLKGSTIANASQWTIPISDASVENWFTVRASTASGIIGRRPNAVNWPGGLSACPQALDLSLASILSPGGDAILGCGATTKPVTILIKNEGQNIASGAVASYSIDGGAPVQETLPDIAPGESLEFTFATPITLNLNGSITLSTSVSLSGDNYVPNNSSSKTMGIVTESINTTFTESFDASTNLPAGWNIVNPDGGVSWVVYTNPVTGIDGAPTTTIRLNHFAYDQQGEEDYLYMIPVDLNGMASPALQFAYTHASYPGYFDGLRVDVFADCDLGGTPVNVWEQNDPDFAITSTNSSYSPSASSDWRQAFISLDQFAGQKIVVRFASLNGYGNNTYLDNIGVSDLPVTMPVASFQMADTICRTDTLIITADPSSGNDDIYTWSFSSSASPSTATGPGPHTVYFPLAGNRIIRLIVSNAFGADTLTKLLHVRNFPTSNFTSSQNGTEVSFTNSSANATSYLWNFGDGNTSTATNPVHVYAAIGDYDVTLSAINPCKTIDKTSSVMLVSGSVEATGLEQFSISPNPNQGEFKISISTQHPVDAMISLLDPTGKQIIAPVALAIPQGTKIFSFGKPNLAAGIYQVLVQTATGNAAFNVTVVK